MISFFFCIVLFFVVIFFPLFIAVWLNEMDIFFSVFYFILTNKYKILNHQFPIFSIINIEACSWLLFILLSPLSFFSKRKQSKMFINNSWIILTIWSLNVVILLCHLKKMSLNPPDERTRRNKIKKIKNKSYELIIIWWTKRNMSQVMFSTVRFIFDIHKIKNAPI